MSSGKLKWKGAPRPKPEREFFFRHVPWKDDEVESGFAMASVLVVVVCWMAKAR